MRPFDLLGWLLAAVVLIGFSLPWLKLTPVGARSAGDKLRVASAVAEAAEAPWHVAWLEMDRTALTQAWKEPWEGMNGWELALAGNAAEKSGRLTQVKESKLLGSERVGDRLRLLYAVPALAVCAAIFLSGCRAKRWPLTLPLVLCAGLYGLMRWRLNETTLERLVNGVQPGLGFWLGAYGLLALALVLVLRMALPERWKL